MIDNAFECTAAVSSGIRAALDELGPDDITVVGWAGDGGTVDIGIQALSGMVDRGTDVLYVMYDNEAYMNTGIQCSGSTPSYAWTTTTPLGRSGVMTRKKRIMDMMVANGIAFGATVNVAFPEHFIKEIQKLRSMHGPRFIHALTPCPSGWQFDPRKCIEVARHATLSGIFPLYEFYDGKYTMTKEIKNKEPVAEYLHLQGRYGHLTV